MKLNLLAHACDPDRLDSFLGGELNDSQEHEFHLHLNTCANCRRLLQERAAEPEAWREAEELLRPSQFDSQLADDSENSSLSHRSRRQPLQIHNVLVALGPTDDPAMLGRLGGYEVSGVVGAGGMGVVLKAIDKSLDRTVAIKVLAPHLATSGAARKRFAREAKAAAAVLHPNVIAIHSVSNDESLPYLVMPYVRGTSLQKRLDKEGPLSLQEILRIGSQIAAGLAAAHAQGLVHRDIKPANILLEDGVERVTITDFGLARAVDDATITHSGVIAGTPQYMSPEQARGEAVDGRSDLFSLGSVLYAICAGRPPFRAETTYGVMRRITDDEPTSIREINPDIPVWLCSIIARLMSKKATDRFASAEEVREMLEQCLAHVQQPATVPLPQSCLSLRESDLPFAERKGIILRYFSSLSRPMLGVFAMIAALGLGLLGMFVWQATEAPDISGNWTGDEWGTVVLQAKQPGHYEGTFGSTGKDKPAPSTTKIDIPSLGPNPDKDKSGTVHLKWSRVERRFNGTWEVGDDRKGKISLRLVDDEIRGAWTTAKNSAQATGSARLSDLLWKRSSNNATTSQQSYIGKLLIGKIQRIDIERKVAWINIGTADSVKAGMWFQVREKAAGDESEPRLKGSIEVIRVLDQHLSEVRILNEDLENKLTANDEVIGVAKTNIPGTDESLEGVWELALPPDVAAERPENRRRRFVVAGDWQGTFQGDQRISASRLKVEPQHTPKRLSFIGVEDKWMRGIYEVKDGGLRLNIAPDTEVFPKSFGTKHSEFKRVTGKLAEAQIAALEQYAKTAATNGTSTPKNPTSATAKIDKTTLPRVSKDLQSRTTVLNGLVSGGGIIERIKDGTVYFTSGDRIVVPAGTMLLLPIQGDRPIAVHKSDLLEPGMAIAYSIRDGKIEKLVLTGIVEQARSGESIFDTIKDLQLRKGSESMASIDGRFPIRISGSDGEVLIKIGETKLIKLPKPTESIEWRAGEFKPEGIDDIEPFDYVLVHWRDNGRITWTCYASPAIPAKRKDDGDSSKKTKDDNEPQPTKPQPDSKPSAAETGIRVRLFLSAESHSREMLARNKNFDGLSIMGTRISGIINGKPASNIVGVIAHKCRLESFKEIVYRGKKYWEAEFFVPQGPASGSNHFLSLSQKSLDEMMERGVEFQLDHYRGQEVQTPNNGPDRTNARSTLDAYIVAALSGESEKASDLAINRPADTKQLAEFFSMLNLKTLAVDELWIDNQAMPTKALAVSELLKLKPKQANGLREGSLVFTLTLVEKTWFVSDIDLESEEDAEEKLKKFRKANPHAIGLPPLDDSRPKIELVGKSLIPKSSEAELKKFQGSWVLVSSEKDGKEISEAKNPYALTFTGTHWKVHHDDAVAIEGTLKLVDVASTPMKMDLHKPKGLGPDPTVDYGIYEWKEDTLRYCVRNGPADSGLPGGLDISKLRPMEFSTKNGDGRILYVWKRAEPSAASKEAAVQSANAAAAVLVEQAKVSEGGAESGPLKFLAEYPKQREQTEGELKALTAPQFEAAANARKLRFEKSEKDGDPKYYFPTGDGHTVIVMFRDGKWSGIQRIRGEQHPEPASVETPEGPGKP